MTSVIQKVSPLSRSTMMMKQRNMALTPCLRWCTLRKASLLFTQVRNKKHRTCPVSVGSGERLYQAEAMHDKFLTS